MVYYIPKARQVTFSEKQFRSYIYAIPVMRVNQDHLYSVIQSFFFIIFIKMVSDNIHLQTIEH